MPKHKPVTSNEIDAARQYINRTLISQIMFKINFIGDEPVNVEESSDRWPCCPNEEEASIKHQHSMRHVAYRNGISLSRMRHIVKVVKVMDALNDKHEDNAKWKRI